MLLLLMRASPKIKKIIIKSNKREFKNNLKNNCIANLLTIQDVRKKVQSYVRVKVEKYLQVEKVASKKATGCSRMKA